MTVPVDNKLKITEIVEDENGVSGSEVVLETGENEFYTLEELDEVDQSMAYLARKFSNIRFKKPRSFQGKGQSSFTGNNYNKSRGGRSSTNKLKRWL